MDWNYNYVEQVANIQALQNSECQHLLHSASHHLVLCGFIGVHNEYHMEYELGQFGDISLE